MESNLAISPELGLTRDFFTDYWMLLLIPLQDFTSFGFNLSHSRAVNPGGFKWCTGKHLSDIAT